MPQFSVWTVMMRKSEMHADVELTKIGLLIARTPSSYSWCGRSVGTSVAVQRQHRLGLREGFLQRERPTSDGGCLIGSITLGLPRPSMCPLVVVAGRQRERHGLGRKQRLRLGEEARCWWP